MLKREISIDLHRVPLHAILRIPAHARGLVLFAHGSGSGRHSPRNNYVAERFADSAMATLLSDLLTEHEEQDDVLTAQWRFNIPLLTDRLIGVTAWARQRAELERLPIGYFGASTGAAAALVAATRTPDIAALVSRGGRADLAGSALEQVQSPTLLIVGGEDREVLALNRSALARLRSQARLEIVPGATHLFVEPGALEQVATLAARWFEQYLGAGRLRPPGSARADQGRLPEP